MDVTIREARPEDVPALTIVRQQALESAFREEYDAGTVADIVARAGGGLSDWITAEEYTVLLVETEVTAVGYGAVRPDDGELTALYTSPDYQREGFGSELLARLESAVDGDATIEVTVPEHAVGFFEQQGYDVVGECDWQGRPGTVLEDEQMN